MKIAGIDVSKDSVTVALLDRLPSEEMKKFCKTFKPLKFKVQDIEKLLALEFDAAVLEPTGIHYSRIWAEKIRASGRIVRWVGHQEIAAYRKSYKLPDKTDKTDSIAIACYGLERWDKTGYFLSERAELPLKLRELYLRTQFLNSAATPLINRLRQQLSHECPELAQKAVGRAWLAPVPGMWLAIANEKRSQRWEDLIQQSQGLGISQFSEHLAQGIIHNDRAAIAVEKEIEAILQDAELQRYLEVMEHFRFGRRTSTALLSSIYPIEKFKGHHNPLGAFKACCGMAQIWHESGDYTGWIPGGSAEVRSALWRWAFGTIPQNKVNSPELEMLRDYYQNGTTVTEDGELKTLSPGKGNQRLMRTVRRAVTMLYRQLKTIE
jgi:transposase